MKFTKSIFAPLTGHAWGETVVFNFEISHLNPDASFSLTVDVYRGKVTSDRNLVMCGQVTDAHNLIPWVQRRAARWHMWTLNGNMHYTANALYWLGWQGWHMGRGENPPNLDHFKSLTNWGIIPADLPINLDTWVATNDPIVQNHPDEFASGLGWPKREHFDFLPAYVAQETAAITAYLKQRLARVRLHFIEDMLYIFGEHGGFATVDIMRELES